MGGRILQHVIILIIRDDLEGDRLSGLYGLVTDDAEARGTVGYISSQGYPCQVGVVKPSFP